MESSTTTHPNTCTNPTCLNEALLACTRCGITYCSATCQLANWPTHKPICRRAAPVVSVVAPVVSETENSILCRVFKILEFCSEEDALVMANSYEPDEALRFAALVMKDFNRRAIQNPAPDAVAHIRMINSRPPVGKTALMAACINIAGMKDVVIIMIMHGADVTIADDVGKTAADYCDDPNYKQLLILLST